MTGLKKPGLYGDERRCWLCWRQPVHRHHIYPGNGRRDVSEDEGCWVYLCPEHHNMSESGVHFDRSLDAFFRADCQRRWEAREGVDDPDHSGFIHLFGCSYL